jgi:septum formation protein
LKNEGSGLRVAPPLLILASRSPRRAELLRQIGIPFEVQEADIDEAVLPGETPDACARRLAENKARRVFEQTGGRLPVLGADTIVVVGTSLLGKPANPLEHLQMLESLSGKSHEVITGVCVITAEVLASEVVRSGVEFSKIEGEVAARYVATGEGRDKAGGYAIQGIGGIFVKKLVGSYSAVVGLPLAETESLLRRAGLDTWQNRQHEI